MFAGSLEDQSALLLLLLCGPRYLEEEEEEEEEEKKKGKQNQVTFQRKVGIYEVVRVVRFINQLRD